MQNFPCKTCSSIDELAAIGPELVSFNKEFCCPKTPTSASGDIDVLIPILLGDHDLLWNDESSSEELRTCTWAWRCENLDSLLFIGLFGDHDLRVFTDEFSCKTFCFVLEDKLGFL